MTAHVVSINVGQPQEAVWAGRLGRTAIVKAPVSGPVRVEADGLAGDQVADVQDHGGTHKAVYAFSREDLDVWSERLGREIPNGLFGENLTTRGIDVNAALMGERWRVGTTLLEVAEVRIPCRVFASYLGLEGFDHDKWVKRFTVDARPGPYLRVLQAGSSCAGDELHVVHRPHHDITVSLAFEAMTTERTLLPRLLDVGESLSPLLRHAADKYVAASQTRRPPVG